MADVLQVLLQHACHEPFIVSSVPSLGSPPPGGGPAPFQAGAVNLTLEQVREILSVPVGMGDSRTVQGTGCQ